MEGTYPGHTALRLPPCSNACSRLQPGHIPGAHHVEQPLHGSSLEHFKKSTLLSFLPKGSSRLHFQSLLLSSQLQQSGVISFEQLRKLRPKQARDSAERQRTKLSDACPLGPCEWSESWPGEGEGYGQPKGPLPSHPTHSIPSLKANRVESSRQVLIPLLFLVLVF